MISLQKFYILERKIQDESKDLLSEVILNDFSIKRLTLSSNDLLKQYMEFEDEVKKDDVFEWLSAGNICLLSMTERKIIGSVWLTTKYYSFSRFKKVRLLLENTANITKVFVLPQFRAKGIAFKLISNVLQSVLDKDIKKATTVIYCHNKPSLRCFSKLGFEIKYKLYIFTFWFLRYYYIETYKNHSKRN